MLGDHLGAGEVDALAHDDELVATEPSDRIRGSDRTDQAARDSDEQRVADAVTEAVVHHLEMVDVDEEHRERASLADGPLLGSAENVEELGSVRELGQPIVGRFIREGVLVRACRSVTSRPLSTMPRTLGSSMRFDARTSSHRFDPSARSNTSSAGVTTSWPAVSSSSSSCSTGCSSKTT